VDIERTILVERKTRVALIARLGTYGVLAVDSLREDSCAGGFTHTTRSAEEVGMCQLTTLDCIFQCRGDVILSHHACEGGRAILSSRYYKLLHNRHKVNKLCLFLAIFPTKCRRYVIIFAIRQTKSVKTTPKNCLAKDLLCQFSEQIIISIKSVYHCLCSKATVKMVYTYDFPFFRVIHFEKGVAPARYLLIHREYSDILY
jgi:hypothetical protein